MRQRRGSARPRALLDGRTVVFDGDAPRLATCTRTLPCGLDVVVHPDASSPQVAVSVWYRVGSSDEVGNTPMELNVKGLPTQDHGYYELFVWRHGKPGFPCTGFRMLDGKTTVYFTVPYELKPGTQLVVTEVMRGKAPWPGHVVMRSV